MSDTVQNGKGSKVRPYKVSQYAENYDAIDWRKERKPARSLLKADLDRMAEILDENKNRHSDAPTQ